MSAEQLKAFDEITEGWNAAKLEWDALWAIAKLTGHFHEGISEETLLALKGFEKHFEQRATVKTGKHFEEADLIAAWRCYEANWGEGTVEALIRRVFWSRRILGSLEQDLAAVDAQIVCREVDNVENERKLDQRSFNLQTGDPIFPLSRSPTNILGRTSFVEIGVASRNGSWMDCAGGYAPTEKLYRIKTQAFNNFIINSLRPLALKLQETQKEGKSDGVIKPASPSE